MATYSRGFRVPEAGDPNAVPGDLVALVETVVPAMTAAAIDALSWVRKPAGWLAFDTTKSKLVRSTGAAMVEVLDGDDTTRLKCSGGTMTGELVLSGGALLNGARLGTLRTPVEADDAAPKSYVDAHGSWQSYTPTLGQGGAVAWDAGASRARYVQVGKMVVVYCSLKATGSGVAGQPITVSLPVAAVAIGAGVGSFYNFDPGVAHRSGAAYLNATTYADFYRDGETDRFGIAGPTLGATDVIGMSIVYEAA